MKYLLISYFLLFIFICSWAHPPIGIVKDSKGNIYYTDLKQVWKLDPSTGKKTIVVPNVHTHELYMDAKDNLYGEHLWYNGEKLNTWGYYVWCLKNDGTWIKIIEPREGFRSDYSFVRDSAANMFWIEGSATTRFMRKTPSGEITKISEEKLGHIGWLYSTPGGTLYFTEGNKFEKLTADGKIVVLADHLGSKTTDFTFAGRDHDGYGIWSDRDNNIYIAMINAKKVKRISPDGRVETTLVASSLWTPCSGMFDDNGNLWLLEFTPTNECRVRKVSKEDLKIASTSFGAGKAHLLVTTATGVLVILLVVLFRIVVRSQKLKSQKAPTLIGL